MQYNPGVDEQIVCLLFAYCFTKPHGELGKTTKMKNVIRLPFALADLGANASTSKPIVFARCVWNPPPARSDFGAPARQNLDPPLPFDQTNCLHRTVHCSTGIYKINYFPMPYFFLPKNIAFLSNMKIINHFTHNLSRSYVLLLYHVFWFYGGSIPGYY